MRGMIHLKDARTAFDCMIRDISSRGARLDFSGTTPTPDVFELYIPLKEQTLRANVTWRCGEKVGVAFPHQVSAMEPSKAQDLSRRLDRIEIEIDTFKRACQKLRSSMKPIRI
jgi:hypothetical protein